MSMLAFGVGFFSGKSQRWQHHSTNESQVTNAVGALLDITMINEWREAGGRRRKTVGIRRQNAYRNTDAIDGYVQDNSFTITFQCNLIYGRRGWYI